MMVFGSEAFGMGLDHKGGVFMNEINDLIRDQKVPTPSHHVRMQ